MDKKKEVKKGDKFKMDDKYSASLIESRQQEMESILPGFMTVCEGHTLYSKQLNITSSRK